MEGARSLKTDVSSDDEAIETLGAVSNNARCQEDSEESLGGLEDLEQSDYAGVIQSLRENEPEELEMTLERRSKKEWSDLLCSATGGIGRGNCHYLG